MKKCLLTILLCLIIVVAFTGCSAADNSGSNGENNTGDTSDGNGKNNGSNSQAQGKMEYQITDTGFKYLTNKSGETMYACYVEITNTGDCDIYLNKCVFDFEDNNGHLLHTDKSVWSFSAVVAPGEKSYFYNFVGSSTIDKDVSLDNGLKFAPQVKISEAKGKPVSCPVSDVSVRKGDSGEIKVIGRIENNTDKKLDYLCVNIVFYDAQGKVLAVNGGTVEHIEAGMKESFEYPIWGLADLMEVDDIASTKVVAEEMYIQE